MRTYTVSVIIPTYNSQETIDTCLKSVLRQTYPVYEIIIINDGSTDNSVNIIENIIINNKTETSIKLIQQENSGPSKARNWGIDYASGDWIAFLDSDDYWDEAKIEKQICFINKHPNTVLISCFLTTPASFDFTKLSPEKIIYKNSLTTSCVVVKTENLKHLKFNENQKYSEDYRLWLMILFKFPNDCYILGEALSFQVSPKSNFGETGLSSKLWQMEKGELSNFIYIWKKEYISFFSLIKCSCYSLVRYLRRVIITRLRKSRKL